ncbi:MAG: hypothetical protein ACJ8F1_06960 [Polyangia bacterium]
MTTGILTIPLRPASRPFAGGGGAMAVSLLLGVAGAVALGIGLVRDPRQAFFSYLIAYAYVLGLVLGAQAFVLSVHAARATWPTAVRRLAEAITATLPLLAVLAIPIFAGADQLYPWMHPERIAREEVREIVLHKRPLMNLPFVVVRAAVYFTYFGIVASAMRRWSLRMDHPADPTTLADLRRRMRLLGGGALPAFGILGTMAAWDWLMSLSPNWMSTMFGLYYLSGGFVTALAAISLLAVLGKRAGYLAEIGPSHFYALGRMMFGFLVFWAYTAYFQYLLSWEANRPPEAEWFWRRSVGAYGAVGLFVAFGAFGLPFVVLLTYWIKRRAWGIGAVAVWLLLSHYFDVHWIVAAARERRSPFSWMDGAAALCVGGLTVAFAVWRQRGHLLAPVYDPTFPRAMEYQSR